MNKQQEYLILDALDRNIVSSRERDVALRALAGNKRAQQKIIPTLSARRISKFTPTAEFVTPKSQRDENFDYETGADSGLRALLSFGETPGDREAILRKLVGDDGFIKDAQGRLALTEKGQVFSQEGKTLSLKMRVFLLAISLILLECYQSLQAV